MNTSLEPGSRSCIVCKATSGTQRKMKTVLMKVDLKGFLAKVGVELNIKDRLILDRSMILLKEFVRIG